MGGECDAAQTIWDITHLQGHGLVSFPLKLPAMGNATLRIHRLPIQSPEVDSLIVFVTS